MPHVDYPQLPLKIKTSSTYWTWKVCLAPVVYAFLVVTVFTRSCSHFVLCLEFYQANWASLVRWVSLRSLTMKLTILAGKKLTLSSVFSAGHENFKNSYIVFALIVIFWIVPPSFSKKFPHWIIIDWPSFFFLSLYIFPPNIVENSS